MKKVLATVAAIGCVTAAGAAFGGIPAGTGVNGSLHDMTRVVPGTADTMGRVCVYCHTPHHAVVKDGSDGTQLPLWNHNLTPDTEFTPYTWATPNNSNDGAFDISDPLAGPSRLCMSCHDGSIAIDEHGSAFAQAGGLLIKDYGNTHDGVGRANLTKDLSNTHPIGFDYNDIAAFRNAKSLQGSGSKVGGEWTEGTEIVPSTLGYATGITINNVNDGAYNKVTRATGGKRIADNLYGGNIMTCATCHEVHNKENATQDDYLRNESYPDGLGKTQKAPNYFLYAKQTESLICLSCHVK